MASTPPNPQRDFARQLVMQLRRAGYEALWAGGCVRDELLGRTPKDYDVATSARPDQVRELFGDRPTLPIGAAFGVIAVRGPRGAGTVEVATFRTDGAYSDGRRPDEVRFSTPEHDAQRRDFTINGLFFDPLAEQVIDYVGGRADLERRVIRAIGLAEERFEEDKLRMLRAVRFAATFEFTLEAETQAAVTRHAAEISRVSPERIAGELRRMLVHPTRARALELLLETGLLHAIVPPLAELAGLEREPALALLHALEEPTFAVAWAALARRLRPSSSDLAAWGKQLRLSNEEIEGAAWFLPALEVVRNAPRLPWSRVQRVLVHPRVEELMTLLAAEVSAGQAEAESLAFCRERLNWSREELDPPPLLTGDDLIAHGVPRGPAYRDLLEAVRTEQLERRISTRDEALALIDRLRAAE